MQNDNMLIEPITYDPNGHRSTVRVPAGVCPIKFSRFWDLEGCCPPDTVVCSWFWEVRQYGLRRGEFLTAEAIAYWVRSEFDVFEDNYENITAVIYDYARVIGDYLAPKAEDVV